MQVPNTEHATAIGIAQTNGPRTTSPKLCKITKGRVLQPPHKLKNFIVATSTLAQVGGYAQKPFGQVS